jgi:starvation-inducible DNA-binding protein
MNSTRNPLAPATRDAMVNTLNVCLANAVVVSMMAKQAHWNVRGTMFGPLHGLFDKVYGAAAGWADELAERAAALGGEVRGTPAQVVAGTTLATNAPLGYDPVALCAAVAGALATFSGMLSESQRLAGGESVVRGDGAAEGATGEEPAPTPDLATQDVFITMQREADKLLWKVEASMVQRR